MKKIAVCLTKGGVGKTTTAVNLSAGLALAGFRVLLIDTDTQGHSGYMLGLQPRTGLAELITGDLILEDVIVEARERLWLLAGGADLPNAKRDIAGRGSGGEKHLTNALSPIEGDYDFVILDTSPGWDIMTINVLFLHKK